MATDWTPNERCRVETGIKRYPVKSGMCAALARVVHKVGSERDATTRGKMIRPQLASAARFIVPRYPSPPRWASHTFVETHKHVVDALTGADGCLISDYMTSYWDYADCLEILDVDVASVDSGIQEVM